MASKWLWEWGALLLEMCSSISCGLVLLTYIMLLHLHFLITRSFTPLSFRHFPTCSFCFSATTCLKPVLEVCTLLCCCWSTVYWFQAVGLSPCFVTKGCMWVRLCGLHMGCKWQYYFTFSFTWQRSLTFSLATNWKSDFGCPVMQLAWKWCSVIRNGMGPPERVAWTSFTCC